MTDRCKINLFGIKPPDLYAYTYNTSGQLKKYGINLETSQISLLDTAVIGPGSSQNGNKTILAADGKIYINTEFTGGSSNIYVVNPVDLSYTTWPTAVDEGYVSMSNGSFLVTNTGEYTGTGHASTNWNFDLVTGARLSYSRTVYPEDQIKRAYNHDSGALLMLPYNFSPPYVGAFRIVNTLDGIETDTPWTTISEDTSAKANDLDRKGSDSYITEACMDTDDDTIVFCPSINLPSGVSPARLDIMRMSVGGVGAGDIDRSITDASVSDASFGRSPLIYNQDCYLLAGSQLRRLPNYKTAPTDGSTFEEIVGESLNSSYVLSDRG